MPHGMRWGYSHRYCLQAPSQPRRSERHPRRMTQSAPVDPRSAPLKTRNLKLAEDRGQKLKRLRRVLRQLGPLKAKKRTATARDLLLNRIHRFHCEGPRGYNRRSGVVIGSEGIAIPACRDQVNAQGVSGRKRADVVPATRQTRLDWLLRKQTGVPSRVEQGRVHAEAPRFAAWSSASETSVKTSSPQRQAAVSPWKAGP